MTHEFEGLPLFAPCARVDTSEEAAASIAPEPAATIRQAVYALLRDHRGLTCEEIESRMGLPHQTVSARLWELERQGRAHKSATRRQNFSGRWARVYVVDA